MHPILQGNDVIYRLKTFQKILIFSIVLICNLPSANAQGVWVAQKNAQTIYVIPVMHGVAFPVDWGNSEIEFAVNNSEIAYIENSGIRFDLNDYPEKYLEEYKSISQAVEQKLQEACKALKQEKNCYVTWPPYFAFILIQNSMGFSMPNNIGIEYFLVKKLEEKSIEIIPLENKKEMFLTVSRASAISAVRTANLHEKMTPIEFKKFFTESTMALQHGDELEMKRMTSEYQSKLFDGDFFDFLIIERNKNMIKKILSGNHKSLAVLVGFAHVFGEKDSMLDLLKQDGFIISKLKREVAQ
jgi:uncharacterized protein YbaP (TraB family)